VAAIAAAPTRQAAQAAAAGLTHAATAVAASPCKLLVLSADDLRRFGRRVRGPLAEAAAVRRDWLQQRLAAVQVGGLLASLNVAKYTVLSWGQTARGLILPALLLTCEVGCCLVETHHELGVKHTIDLTPYADTAEAQACALLVYCLFVACGRCQWACRACCQAWAVPAVPQKGPQEVFPGVCEPVHKHRAALLGVQQLAVLEGSAATTAAAAVATATAVGASGRV
jgi:hypothetical protein